MNKLLQTTAIALLLTVPGVAFAQSTNTGTDTNTNTTTQTDSMQPATEDNTTATQGSATTQTGDSQANQSSGPVVFWVFEDAERQGAMRASDLIGMNVYTVDTDIDTSVFYDAEARRDWEDIGEINDVILNWDGTVRAVILGVGGFLGLGEKDVAVDMSGLRRVQEADGGDWFLVVNSSKTALEGAPAYSPAS